MTEADAVGGMAMQLKKNWFYYFCISLAMAGAFMMINSGIDFIKEALEEIPFVSGMMIFIMLGIWFAVWILAVISAKKHLSSIFSTEKKWVRWIEALVVMVILIMAVRVRISALFSLSIWPRDQFRTFYEIAGLLSDNALQAQGGTYCDQIALFPQTMGYSYVLMLAFRLLGTEFVSGQYLNLFLSTAIILIVYRIARKLGGRIAGIFAMVFSAFWPSWVLHTVVLSEESTFTFLFVLCIWIFVHLMMDYDGETSHGGRAIFLHILLGAVIALMCAVRSAELIVFPAIFLVLVPYKMKLPSKPVNDISLAVRALAKGWIRFIIIFLTYLLLSSIITSKIELAINRTIPSTLSTAGYRLLAGLNVDTGGENSEEDMDVLYNDMEEQRDAEAAYKQYWNEEAAGRKSTPVEMLALMEKKYEKLWGNDAYGADLCEEYLEAQGELTPELKQTISEIRNMGQIVYLIALFLVALCILYMWHEKTSPTIMLLIIYIGTSIYYLFFESQNRYHYFMLSVFAIMAGMGVQYIFKDAKRRAEVSLRLREEHRNEEEESRRKLMEEKQEEERVTELRKEAFENLFDMEKALREGHVIMTVSQAYEKEQTEK